MEIEKVVREEQEIKVNNHIVKIMVYNIGSNIYLKIKDDFTNELNVEIDNTEIADLFAKVPAMYDKVRTTLQAIGGWKEVIY